MKLFVYVSLLQFLFVGTAYSQDLFKDFDPSQFEIQTRTLTLVAGEDETGGELYDSEHSIAIYFGTHRGKRRGTPWYTLSETAQHEMLLTADGPLTWICKEYDFDTYVDGSVTLRPLKYNEEKGVYEIGTEVFEYSSKRRLRLEPLSEAAEAENISVVWTGNDYLEVGVLRNDSELTQMHMVISSITCKMN